MRLEEIWFLRRCLSTLKVGIGADFYLFIYFYLTFLCFLTMLTHRLSLSLSLSILETFYELLLSSPPLSWWFTFFFFKNHLWRFPTISLSISQKFFVNYFSLSLSVIHFFLFWQSFVKTSNSLTLSLVKKTFVYDSLSLSLSLSVVFFFF